MAIAAMILWLFTAGAGIWLLVAGNAGRRQAAAAAAPASEPAAAAAPAAAGATMAGATAAAGATAGAGPAGMASGAPPMTGDGRPPPIPRTKVVSPAGEHPLLEFTHPALAVVGLACWLGFTFTHNRGAAWVSLGVLALALAAGLTWFTRNYLAVLRHRPTTHAFSRRLIALHGVGAAAVIALAVLSALTAAGHG